MAVMQLVPGLRLQLQLVLQLLALVLQSRSQLHPPGSGWPGEGAGALEIVGPQLGVPTQGAISTPGDSVWYSIDATANRKSGARTFVLCAAAAEKSSRRCLRNQLSAGGPSRQHAVAVGDVRLF